jgi:hypothetical protein
MKAMKMTKKDLLDALKDLPDNTPIVLSSDEEGNDFGVLWSIEVDENGNAILFPASGTVSF